MSDNPIENDAARDEKIRQRAYHLWQSEGEPHGQDKEYWERARELVAIEESAGAAQKPNPKRKNKGVIPATVEPVEEASIQENLGEFPDRFADQGEAQPVPKPRAKRAAKATPAP